MSSDQRPEASLNRHSNSGGGELFTALERFPWLMLLRTPRIAFDPRLLALSALGLALMLGGWWALGRAFSGSSVQEQSVTHLVREFGSGVPSLRANASQSESGDVAIPGGLEISATAYLPAQRWDLTPNIGSWDLLSRPFWRAFDSGLSVTGFTYALLCGLWTVAVWSFFGAAVTRVAAVRLTRDERTTLASVARHATKKYGAYFWAPLFPLVGVALLAIPIAVAGLLMRFSSGMLLAAIGWPLCLIAGLLMMIFLTALCFGWPLMWATISVEGTDSFDALSRTYSYVYQRPLHYLFYTLVSTLLGWLAALFVMSFAAGVVYFSLWSASWTSGNLRMAAIVDQLPGAVIGDYPWLDPRVLIDSKAASAPATDMHGMGAAGAGVLGFWLGCVKFLAWGFGISYFWCSTTATYLLLRRQVDATELDDVFLEDEETQYGLPPLDRDAAGVPKVASEEGDDMDDDVNGATAIHAAASAANSASGPISPTDAGRRD